MSDTIDAWKALKDHFRILRSEHGVGCPNCKVKLPKAQPKILMPGQKCWCGYRDPRQPLEG